jgi:GT2 family glycosyltransferase
MNTSWIHIQPELLIVIVNYRTAELTIDCLRSLSEEVAAVPKTHVVVVDNQSGDNSVEAIAQAIDSHGWSWASLMPSHQNGGFAAGNNLAIYPALTSERPPRYFLLLNPDTVVRPGAVQALVEFMDAHPIVGIAGSRLEDPDGTPQRSAFRFPSLWSELDSGLRWGVVSRLLQAWTVAPPVPDQAEPADWVAGASMIVRREVFEQAGLMDDGYFMYYEEVDFCLQAQEIGWDCWYVPASRVVHLVGQSSGVTVTKQRPKRRPTYWFESRQRYFLKNYGWMYAAFADVFWMTGYAIWQWRSRLQGKPVVDPPYLLNDFCRTSILWSWRNSHHDDRVVSQS